MRGVEFDVLSESDEPGKMFRSNKPVGFLKVWISHSDEQENIGIEMQRHEMLLSRDGLN